MNLAGKKLKFLPRLGGWLRLAATFFCFNSRFTHFHATHSFERVDAGTLSLVSLPRTHGQGAHG